MRSRRVRIAFGVVMAAIGAFGVRALAQTAASRGMIVGPDNRCLDIAGNYGASSAPPAGARVTLAPCDGRPSERWLAIMGDWNYTQGIGESCLGFREQPTSSAPGIIEMTVAPCNGHRHSDLTFSMSHLRTTWSDRGCVAVRTANGRDVFTLERCSDASEQHWEMR
jgi:hypothetical protein